MSPNILLIMTDNQPAELLGYYGNDEIHTPHLDRLAQQGIRFDNAYCVNGMCSPCRASVLTGLMPSQHGIHTWLDDRLMDNWPPEWNGIAEFATLPEMLQTHGYQTALIGKYHIGSPFRPQNGFEHWVTFPYGHTRNFWGNRVIENGRETTYPGHSVDIFTDKAVKYIQTRNDNAPFFLCLTYNAPYGHWPAIEGPGRNRFYPLYENTPMHTVPREGLSREAIIRYDLKKDMSGGGIDYSAELTTPNDLPSLRNYYSQMSMVDDGVGQVLAAVQQAGILEETLLIFTADHGFSLGHNGFWGHGQATWPSNAHGPAFSIPLLLHQPGTIAPLQTSSLMVSQIDLFATILEAAGINETAVHPTPSHSLMPLLAGRPFTWDDAVFMEQEETRAIRTPRWLYMERFRGSPSNPFADELYDLVRDPGEKMNLSDDVAYRETAIILQRRLADFFNQYSDPRYDLWHGGVVKANSDKPWLWQDAWGEDWEAVY
ncbi:MAG: sulfatase-like hydrolase/transferase [Chloroflexi bacterium]|nr:sulfatase-like hydrolase/transferase [Chloroflexota bacterium]